MPDPIHEHPDTDFVQEAGPGIQPMGFERRDMGGESALDMPSEELTEFGVKARSQTRMVAGRFFRHRAAMVSLVVLLLMTAAAFLAPRYYQYSYTELTSAHSASPSASHWFGTDELGRDTFAKTMRGSTKSLEVGLLVAIFATLAGVIVGALAGFYGGWLDSALMRITDLFLTIPALAVLLVVANRFRGQSGNWLSIALVITAFAWMYQARLTRSEFLTLREREFVQAARALGASDKRIMLRHLIPNSIGSITVNATLTVAAAILTESALSFLGFGVAPPDTSLGRLVSDGAQAAQTRPWLFYAPGVWLVIILLCVNFMGDGLRDAFDPTQERVRA
jgi:ABC-type dipeptide/oligopeptide/nickel transport system permease subunit